MCINKDFTIRLLLLVITVTTTFAVDNNSNNDTESEDGTSRKILGSSVVTSVSIIMDTGNGSKAVFTDAVGKPIAKPVKGSDLASPINLLNPDRYEFYTFDDNGDLVKRLMSLEEIQGIIATGDDDGFSLESFSSDEYIPEKRVNDVVNNVQNVLKEEMQTHKDDVLDKVKPIFDTPDVSDSWSMILPAIFGNSGEDIKAERPISGYVTPDTIMLDPENKIASATTPRTVSSTITANTEPSSSTSSMLTTKTNINKLNAQPVMHKPLINVEVSSNERSTIPTSAESTTAKNNFTLHKKPDIKDMIPIYYISSSAATTRNPIINNIFSNTASFVNNKKTTPSGFKKTTVITPLTTSIFTSQKPSTLSTTTESPELKTPTSSKPPITKITTTKDDLPALLDLLNKATTNSEVIKKPEIVTKSPAELEFSTFSYINDNSNSGINTEKNNKLDTTEKSSGEELSTLASEYNTFLIEKAPSTTENIKINKYSNDTNTLIVNTTNFLNKNPATDKILDQLLLSSTNIYEINTELSKIITNSVDSTTSTSTKEYNNQNTLKNQELNNKVIFNNKINNIINNINESLNAVNKENGSSYINSELTTTIKDSEISTTETVESTTLQKDLLNSIEQLLSQAVGNIEETLMEVNSYNNNTLKLQQILKSEKNLTDYQSETATLASNLLDNTETTTNDIISTTVFTKDNIDLKPTTTERLNADNILSDGIDSLISQIYFDGITTIEPMTTITVNTNSKTTAISNRKTEENSTNIMETSTISIEDPFTMTIIPSTAKKNSSEPHLINITVISKDHLPTTTEFQDPTYSTTTIDDSTTFTNRNYEPTVKGTTEAETSTFDTTTTFGTLDFKNESVTTSKINKITGTPVTGNTKTNIEINKNDNWTLVPTVSPNQINSTNITANKVKNDSLLSSIIDPPVIVDLVPKPLQGFGLEDSTSNLDTDIYQFVQLCNELAFGFWKTLTNSLSSARSIVISPFSATSTLAMIFLGARGATSGEMNEILKLDDMVTFNPHLIFKNVTESIIGSNLNDSNNYFGSSGIAASTMLRELYSDKSKGRLLGFYKERVRQFYDGHVEEASYKEIGDIIRRRTNLLVKKHTNSKIIDFLKDSNIIPRPPLAGIGVNIFHTDCSQGSVIGRDGELHFVVLPSLRQRRLIPIPAIVFRSGFLAGYEPSLDATAVALGTKDQIVSTIFVIPGQQGISAPGDGLARLEKRLVESSFKKGAWSRLLRSLIPRPGLEVQLPRFSHKSVINATEALKKMGLHDLFNVDKADLRGLNGVANELHLSDMLQINNFATCGESRISETHHVEIYPATTALPSIPKRRNSRRIFIRKVRNLDSDDFSYLNGEMSYRKNNGEDNKNYQRAFDMDPIHDFTYLSLPLSLRPRQARIPEIPRLRFDRPFLYFIRHNPTGLILHMGRFNPRLLP